MKSLKHKKAKTSLQDFVEIVNESKCQPNKRWVDQGKELCNLVQKWQDGNDDILIYWSHNEDKPVVVERFIRTLKIKIYKKWQLKIAYLTLLIWIT